MNGLLVLSFGGPRTEPEVMPFLRRVAARRGIPEERLLEVAEHYYHFGGASPLPAANERLTAGLSARLPDTVVRLGNRNSSPFIADALADFADAGVSEVSVHITSAFSSYSGCRQYRENLADAQAQVGAFDFRLLPSVRTHPLFARIWADAVGAVLPASPADLLFVTHSLPVPGSQQYVRQHEELLRLVVAELQGSAPAPLLSSWQLTYQSASSAGGLPWLGPDIEEVIRSGRLDSGSVVVAPIGFLAENMEIAWDLDVIAAAAAADLNLGYQRAAMPQDDPRYTDIIIDLMAVPPRRCDPACCPAPRHVAQRATAIGDLP
ncbi:MAG: ferrochelatase [Actinobacteria bacterium]|nr:ferrochelatase [Actinomycetota bacterium]